MENTRNDKLLEILIKTRIVNALDETAGESDAYKDALKKQHKALDRLEQTGLSEEQKDMVDRAISAANNCGAAYGTVAYRLGLHDGIKLKEEIAEIK